MGLFDGTKLNWRVSMLTTRAEALASEIHQENPSQEPYLILLQVWPAVVKELGAPHLSAEGPHYVIWFALSKNVRLGARLMFYFAAARVMKGFTGSYTFRKFEVEMAPIVASWQSDGGVALSSQFRRANPTAYSEYLALFGFAPFMSSSSPYAEWLTQSTS